MVLRILARHVSRFQPVKSWTMPPSAFASSKASSSTSVPRRGVRPELPRLPVPALDWTLGKYLQAVKLLVPSDTYEKTAELVDEFQRVDGPKLQKILDTRSADGRVSWLYDWWLQTAYLEFRSPVVIHSSPGIAMPTQKFSDQQDQLKYAAQLVQGILEFKESIDNGTLPQDFAGTHPLCMDQYRKILSTSRIPGEKVDSGMSLPGDEPGAPKHIVVIHNNHFYSVDVYGEDGTPLNEGQLHKVLFEIVQQSGDAPGPAVGALTSAHRDSWGKVYSHLMKDSNNQQVVHQIQKAILVLCLDKPTSQGEGTDREGTDAERRMSTSAAQMLHGGGVKNGNSANRWFDKTIEFIVGTDGNVGLNYEHSYAEGPPVAAMIDHITHYLGKPQDRPAAERIAPHSELKFSMDPYLDSAISEASQEMDKAAAELDLHVLVFDRFGKEFIKSHKLSPDAFIQVALQLAYCRLYGGPCATYESGTTRRFALGRTDTIRSGTEAAVAFWTGMHPDGNEKPAHMTREVKDLFVKAIEAHRRCTTESTGGQGIDRHLLGLKLAAVESGMKLPPFFMDPSYAKIFHFKLSTSQVPVKSESVLCFGPVVPNGYGVCYNPQPNQLNIAVSAFRSNPETDAVRMKGAIRDSLNDLQTLLLSSKL